MKQHPNEKFERFVRNSDASHNFALEVNGGSIVEISAIASGDMNVNGGVVAITNTVSDDSKDIGFARICLVSIRGDVIVDASSESGQLAAIQVLAHGKTAANSEILICAGKDINISNLGSQSISAESKVSEKQTGNIANASVSIGAGGLVGAGTITVNGESNINLIDVDVASGASGSGTPLRIDPTDDENTDPDIVNVYKEEVNGLADSTPKCN